MKSKIFLFLIVGLFILGLISYFIFYKASLLESNKIISPLILKSDYHKDNQKPSSLNEVSKLQNVELSLNQFFDNVSPEVDDQTILILATGDYIPARSVNYLATTKYNFLWPVSNTTSLFTKADVVLVNLEAPLIKDCPLTNEGFVFCGNQKHIESLKAIKTSVVNLSNNHSHNFGEDGILQTTKLFDENNIKYSGIYGENATLNVKGQKITFLGYNEIGENPYPVKPAEKDLIVKDIKEAKKTSDIVVVNFSWGVEYTTDITDSQKNLAKLAIDSGADLIVGNHPHWIQPIQIYNNKLITYAHGNYVFDQMWSEETKIGMVGYYYFKGGTLIDAHFKPTYITNYGQSNIADNNLEESVIKNLKEVSLQLQ